MAEPDAMPMTAGPAAPPAERGEVLLRVEALRLIRGGRVLAQDLSLEIAAGECVALAAPSGAGKSTLLSLLAGLEPPPAGARVERRGKVGLLLQEPALFDFDGWTVGDNLAVVGRTADDPTNPAELLAAVGLDASLLQRRPALLSGGQKRRAGLARALAARPAILLFDEPTAGLDLASLTRVSQVIHDTCRDRRIAVMVVTHDPWVAAIAADRVLFLAPDGLTDMIEPALIRELRRSDPTGERLMSELSGHLHRRLQSPSPTAGDEGDFRPTASLLQPLEDVGRTLDLGLSLVAPGGFVATLGRIGRAGPGAVLMTMASSFAIGVVVMLQSKTGLQRFEATHLLPEVAMGSLVREVLPLVNGLLLGARFGAAISSEIGVVTQSRQVDAMHLLGLSPARLLAAPVLRACLFIFPVAILCGTVAGYWGAEFGAVTLVGLSETGFAAGAARSVVRLDLVIAALKAAAFGLTVALAALRWGLRPKDESSSVGEHTTAAVVEASIWVVLCDLLITRAMAR